MKTLLAWLTVLSINIALSYLIITGMNNIRGFDGMILLKAFTLSLLISSVLYFLTKNSKRKNS